MIQTPRLRLRDWQDADLPPFVRMNADPEVMAHFPAALDAQASRGLLARIRAHFDRHGFGLHALERRRDGCFLGFVGLSSVSFDAPFTPAIEIGWRMARHAWGQGYASEAARAALQHGFGALDLREIVSFTVPANRRSRAVMARIGMTRSPSEDFVHPGLGPAHPLGPHLLYRRRRAEDRATPGNPGQANADAD